MSISEWFLYWISISKGVKNTKIGEKSKKKSKKFKKTENGLFIQQFSPPMAYFYGYHQLLECPLMLQNEPKTIIFRIQFLSIRV